MGKAGVSTRRHGRKSDPRASITPSRQEGLSTTPLLGGTPDPSRVTPTRYSTGIESSIQTDILDVEKLRLCVKQPWSGPSNDVPYQEFKAKVERSLKLFKLDGLPAQLYLLRCLDDPVETRVEDMFIEGLSIDEVWERLDETYNASWRKISLRQNWQSLRQKPGETPTQFAQRVEIQARLMKVAASRHIDDEDIAAKFRESLRDDLREKIEGYFGPRYADLEETREAAEYFESKIQTRNAAARSSPKTDATTKKIPCRVFTAGKYCRFGTKCHFSHDRNIAATPSHGTGQSEVVRPAPSVGVNPSKSTGGVDQAAKSSKICYRYFVTGQCSRGDQCPYPHSAPATNTTTNVAKSQPSTAAADGSVDIDSCGAILYDHNNCKPLTADIRITDGYSKPNVAAKALIDTGSTVNICSLSWIENNGIASCECNSDEVATSSGLIRLADGTNTLRPISRITLSCSTPRANSYQEFLVVESLSSDYDLILGLPALASLGLHICFSSDSPRPVVTSGHGLERYAGEEATHNSNGSDPSGDPAELSSSDGLLPSSCGAVFEPTPTIICEDDVDSRNNESILFSDSMPLRRIVDDRNRNTFHYQLDDLPWSSDRRPFNNRREVEARFRSLEKSLSPSQHIQVQDAFWELIASGTVEVCKEPSGIKSYVPINPVFRDVTISSTTPCRLTVDARRTNEFIRLGSCEGATPITSNLMQWRLAPNVVSLDLSKAYHSITLSPKASDFCGGFLYGVYFRWKRLPFGLRCSSACLHQALYPLLKPFYKRCSLYQYVDDLGLASASISTLLENEDVITKVLNGAGFALQSKKRISSFQSDGVFKQFGYQWVICNDDHQEHCDHILCKLPPDLSGVQVIPTTRRMLSSAYGKWYDPIGLFPAVATRARMNLREAYNEDPAWDSPIDPKHTKAFIKWCRSVDDGPRIALPRALDAKELFMYCDSSNSAWACQAFCPAYAGNDTGTHSDEVIYPLRGTGSVYGVAMASWSIPKKELYCLYKACELMLSIDAIVNKQKKEPKGQRSWCILSDSAIAIYRLKAKNFKCQLTPLETRWLEFIREACVKKGWKVVHVQSERNLADAPSRGLLPLSPFEVKLSEVRQMLSGTPVVQYCPDDPDTTESESPAIVAAISAEAEDADQYDGDGPQGLPVDHAAIKKHQQDDPILKEIREWHNRGQKWSLSFKLPRSFLEREGPLYKLSDDDGLLYRTTLVNTEGEVLPRIAIGHGGHATNDYINTIIDAAHDKYFHLGYPKLAEIIGAVYYTRHLHTAVKRRLSTCDACQRVHAHIKHKRRLGRVRFKGTAPGQVLAVDHMSMTDGKSDSHPNRIFRAIISITCGVTGFTWLRATFSLTIAELIHHLEVLFGDFGAPRILVFDGYAVNTPWLSTNQSQRLKKWASELGIIIVTLPPHGGPYAGWYERKHQFVRHALQVSSLTGAPLDSWPAQLPHIQLALNATPYGKGSDLSPLHLLYSNCGRLPTDPIGDNDEAVKAGVSHLINPAEQSFLQQLHRDNASSFKLKFADYCEHWSKIKEAQQVAYQRRYGARPSKEVVTGDMVLVYSPSGHRMIPNFVGPYKVREILSNSTCRLEISDKGKKSISEVQLLANVVPYRIRDEDEDVMSWIQCCKCKVWHEVSELLFHRFRHEKARFVCAYINKRCGGPQDHTAV